MSFENNDVELLKPDAKNVNTDTSKHSEYLDFIGKYENDLNLLVNAKNDITKKLKENGISNDEINEKLRQLNASISKLSDLIEKFKMKHNID